jgi:serine/threonine-protein kinase
MPWLPGTTLAERLARGWRPSVAAALWYARQAAEGLAALHAAGWVHGDLSPANVMLSGEGHVTLLDLAYAERGEEARSACDRPLLGTTGYLAPERITSRHPAGIRADLYSLGAILFELLTGRPPLTATSLAEAAQWHRQERMPALREVNPLVPVEIDRMVRALLARQPLRRPHDAREVIERLARLEIDLFAARRSTFRAPVVGS